MLLCVVSRATAGSTPRTWLGTTGILRVEKRDVRESSEVREWYVMTYRVTQVA